MPNKTDGAHMNPFSAKERRSIRLNLSRNWLLYLFLLPCLVYVVIFSYAPLYGIQLAFKDFNPSMGIWGSPWVGVKYFFRFFNSYHFLTLVTNTLRLSLTNLVLGFPMPILLALMLCYCPGERYKKLVQTVSYAPHFISVVVIVGMINLFFGTTGPVNRIIEVFGGGRINFMGRSDLFAGLYVGSGIWRNMGWSSIIYIAVLAGVNPELHEAAIVDGAHKVQRIWHIDLPAILPTIVIMLILDVGKIMNIGFEKAFLMQNDVNIDRSEIIATYVYKIGLQSGQYSYSTAIGLFNNVINFVLLIAINRLSRAVSSHSLW